MRLGLPTFFLMSHTPFFHGIGGPWHRGEAKNLRPTVPGASNRRWEGGRERKAAAAEDERGKKRRLRAEERKLKEGGENHRNRKGTFLLFIPPPDEGEDGRKQSHTR